MRHSLILPIWWHFSLVNNKYSRFIRNVIKFENKENRIPTARKLKFSIRISSVNVTKSARYCGFGHIYWRNLHFLCSPPQPPPGHMTKMNRTQGFQKISMSSSFHFMYFQFASCAKRAASIDVALLFLLSMLNTLSILI